MRFITAIRLGFRRTHRRPGLVVIAYLAALLPALLLAGLVAADLGASLDHSTFASEALSGNRFGVWTDFASSDAAQLEPVADSMLPRLALLFLLQMLVSAGFVETLLGRTPRDYHPFLLGIGRHGWRFLRSAVWFLLCVGVLAAAAGGALGGLVEVTQEAARGDLHMYGMGAVLLLALIAFAPLDLAYDLSRISAAAHGEGRTFVGLFRALGHTLRRPLILAPLWLTFALAGLALHLAYLLLRADWSPANAGKIVVLLLAGQLVLLLRGYLRVGFWASEIAYYQAIGEPRWCGRKQSRPPVIELAEPATVQVAEPTPRPAVAPQPEPAAEPRPGLAAEPVAEPLPPYFPPREPAPDAAPEEPPQPRPADGGGEPG